jgi:hypothetical protein
MSKIIGKKEEAKKVEVKAETKAVTPVVKKLTPIKKAAEAVAPESKAEATVKAETAPVAETAKPTVVEAEKPKAERPTMPANFCMDQKDWEGTGVCYDPSSNNCKTCEKDFPETTTICKARAEFLGVAVKASKTAKAKKAPGEKATRTPKNGIAPQSVRIDEMLKAEKPLADMISALAKTDFGGDTEAGKKAAETRVQSHLKAIRTGTYCRADLMKPFVSYLATAAPAAPAPAKA